LGGDFNDILTKKDRHSNAILHKKDPVNNLSILVKVHALIDIWRLKNQEMKQYTWRRTNGI